MYARIACLTTLLVATAACSSDPRGGGDCDPTCAADEVCQSGRCAPTGGADAGTEADALVSMDATSMDAAGQDAGTEADATTGMDAQVTDRGQMDASRPDAGEAPARITFPPRGSVTTLDQITVFGTSVGGAAIQGVSVNGVAATSNDGFATFSAQVPLALGPGDLMVDVDTGAGSQRYLLGAVERQDVLLLAPRDFDRRNNDLFVVDSAYDHLIRIDLTTGARAVVSGDTVGTGSPFSDPRGVVLTADGATAYVVDNVAESIVRVEVATGNRTELSSATAGTGPTFGSPRRLVLDAAGNRLLVCDSSIDAVIAVDLTTGNRTVISDDDRGMGPPLSSPRDLAIDASRNRLLVADSGASALFAIDLTSGDRSVLQGQGAFFATPRGVIVSSDGSTAYVADGEIATLFSVDLATGDRTVVADANSGVGPWFDPRRVGFGDNGQLLVLDYITDAIVSVDPAQGTKTLVATSAAGTGPHFGGPWGIALDPRRPFSPALVVDNFFERVYEHDVAFGQRRIVSELIHPGPNLDQPYGATWDPAGRLLLVDAVLDALIAVDVSSGARSVVSNEVTGAGTAFNAPRDVAVSANGTIYVVDSGADAVFSVDPSTGDRTVVSNDSVGSGPAFDEPWAVVVDAAGRLWVADSGLDEIVSVDPANGARTVGPADPLAFVRPRGLALGPNGALFVTDEARASVIEVAANGARRLVAGDSAGQGANLSEPAALVLHPDGYLLVVDANDAIVAVHPTTGDRVFASK